MFWKRIKDRTAADSFSNDEPLIISLQVVIRICVRVLAILMTAVIAFGVLDVVYVIYLRLKTEPFLLLNISDILATFGAFMAVLIAVEIFINIKIYLRSDVIHVKAVMATALMAIARKVIVLDMKVLSPQYLYGLAAVVVAMSVGYFLINKLPHGGDADANISGERVTVPVCEPEPTLDGDRAGISGED